MMWCAGKPRATFLAYVRPALTFGKFFGSTLFSLEEESGQVPDVLYVVPVLLALIASFYDTYPMVLSVEHYNWSLILKTEDVLTVSSAIATAIIQPVYYFVRRKSYRKLILEVDRMSEVLSKEGDAIYPNPYKDIVIVTSLPIIATLRNMLVVIGRDFKYYKMAFFFGVVFEINLMHGVVIRRVLREIFKQYSRINRRLQAEDLRAPEIVKLIKYHATISKTARNCNDLFNVNTSSIVLPTFIYFICTTHFTASYFVGSQGKSGDDMFYGLSNPAILVIMVPYVIFLVEQWMTVTSESYFIVDDMLLLFGKTEKNSTFLEYLEPILVFGRIFANIFFPSTVVTVACSLPLTALILVGGCAVVVQFYRANYQGGKDNVVVATDLMTICLFVTTIFAKIAHNIFRRRAYENLLLKIHQVNVRLGKRVQAYPSLYRTILLEFFGSAVLLANNIFTSFLNNPEKVNPMSRSFFLLNSQFTFTNYFIMYSVKREIRKQFGFINAQLKNAGPDVSIDGIGELVRLHQDAGRVANSCSEFFGPLVLLELVSKFIGVIDWLYFTSSCITTRGECFNVATLTNSMMWVFVLMLYFVFTVKVWADITKEAHKTATYIHDIWNNLASRNEIDNSTKHLQLISLQLYNSRLNFTAYGFFPLDWTLLHKIVGAVTTYVVILIQFEISSSTKNSS